MENEYLKGNPFFTLSSNNQKQYEYLNQDIETEIAIVGGGITGAILRILLINK